MIGASVLGIGIWGPGLPGWIEAEAVLRGERPFRLVEHTPPAPHLLAERERRRATPAVRLALHVACEAAEASRLPVEDLAIVFASSLGDGQMLHQLLCALARPERLVSPTQFHNSVHNAAAGYWSIGTGAQAPASSIAGHDFSFGAALLKGAAQAAVEGRPVLVVAFDLPFPAPLDAVRRLNGSLAVALVLSPGFDAAALAGLDIAWRAGDTATEDTMGEPALDALRSGNPAGRALPLLQRIARAEAGVVRLADGECGHLAVTLTPCSTATR